MRASSLCAHLCAHLWAHSCCCVLLLLDDDHFESDRRELAVPQLQIEPLGQSASEWQLAAAEAMMTAKGSRLFRFVGHPIFAPDGEAWLLVLLA